MAESSIQAQCTQTNNDDCLSADDIQRALDLADEAQDLVHVLQLAGEALDSGAGFAIKRVAEVACKRLLDAMEIMARLQAEARA